MDLNSFTIVITKIPQSGLIFDQISIELLDAADSVINEKYPFLIFFNKKGFQGFFGKYGS